MRSLNWILNKPTSPIIDVTLYLSKRSFVKEHHKDKNLTDREYTLFALLVYARVLRLLPSANPSQLAGCYNTFMEIADSFKKDNAPGHFQVIEQTMNMISCSHHSVHKWRVRMGKMHIYTGVHNTGEVQKFAYVAFMYAWLHISPGNWHKLTDAFATLSRLEQQSHISPANAVRHPDTIINALFP